MRKAVIRITAVFAALLCAVMMSAQETDGEHKYILDGLDGAFNKEGRQAWKLELSVRQVATIGYAPQMANIGVRVSPDWVFGIGAGYGEFRGTYFIPFHLYNRIYIPLGTKQRFSLYSDQFLIYSYIFKAYQTEPQTGSGAQKGDGNFIWSIQPGISVRLWGKSNLFLGPTILGEFRYPVPHFGLHLGLAF